jgi:hypothetical protein
VPLFVEEVTRLLLELGEQGGIQAVPPTLQQSLSARLDRLGPAREVPQIGAVIGRDLSYSLLRSSRGWTTPLYRWRWNGYRGHDAPRQHPIRYAPDAATDARLFRYERRCGSLHQACDRVLIDHAAAHCGWGCRA